nr:VENN motif pre-toxin domain-containing protein [Haemophilus influenzae]
MADVIAKELYGKKPNQLNRGEKEVVSSVSQAAGALVGGAAANSSQGIGVGLTTTKNAVENNFLSDASRARLNALKTKYHRGEKLTNKEKLEFRDLIESDQRSDILLDKFRKDPNSLNSKEREAFLSYVDRYYIETVTGNTASGYKLASPTSLVNAQNRFESEYLINDPVPKRDYGHFPFAGTDAQRSQAVNTLPEESKNWLGWRSEKHSRDEDMYYTVKNELDASENYKNSANGKIAYSVKDGLEAGSMFALGSGTAVVRSVALMEKAAATVGGEAITLANKGGQVLRLGKDAATKAYIDGQIRYVNLVDKGIKAYNTTLTKAANAYINGQLAYADAIAKGVNTAKIAAREGIEGTRELVSQGIYYSYRPAELVVDTGKAIASMPKPYKTALGVSTGAGVAGESFYYMDGSKSLSNPADVLGSVYNVGVNAAYDSAFYTANPLQSLGLDTLKGIAKDGKGANDAFYDSGKSNSISMSIEGLGKKFGLSDTMTKFISSSVNNAVDYNKESINRDKPSKGE